MIPTSITILHALENHEHTVCTSVDEHHIHTQEINCDEFHKQLTVFSKDFTLNHNVIPAHYYQTIFIDKPQIIREIYHSKKYSRGPPNFTL